MADWSSDVAICNGALGLLGAERIVAIDDTTDQGSLCLLFYEQARDATMAAYPWNFAVARKNLGAKLSGANAPLYDWAYAYQLPRTANDFCLRVLELEGNDPYRVEGSRLLTDATTAYIKYIKRIIGPSDWSPLFKNAMAAHLAMLLAMPITKSASMMQAMAQLYEARLSEAYSVDTQEGTPDLIDSNEIIDVR